MGLVCHAKNGMGKKWPLLAEKNGMGVPVLAAKNSTPLPKMELLFSLTLCLLHRRRDRAPTPRSTGDGTLTGKG